MRGAHGWWTVAVWSGGRRGYGTVMYSAREGGWLARSICQVAIEYDWRNPKRAIIFFSASGRLMAGPDSRRGLAKMAPRQALRVTGWKYARGTTNFYIEVLISLILCGIKDCGLFDACRNLMSVENETWRGALPTGAHGIACALPRLDEYGRFWFFQGPGKSPVVTHKWRRNCTTLRRIYRVYSTAILLSGSVNHDSQYDIRRGKVGVLIEKVRYSSRAWGSCLERRLLKAGRLGRVRVHLSESLS